MKRAETQCSIDGCTGMVLARGWCGKHYSRWRNTGNPLMFKGTREPSAPAVSSRRIGRDVVHFTEAGETFVLVTRVRHHERVPARRYGRVFVCEGCGKEAFSAFSGKNRFRFCSHDCAGPASGRLKLGRQRDTPIKKQVDYLDRLFSVLVRFVGGSCVHCGKTDMQQCAHGFGRRYRNVRWDLRNAFCLCARCHMYFTHRPIEWDEWLRARWGDDLYTELRQLALQTSKIDLAVVKSELVAETLARGVTANRLPKSIAGWVGLTKQEDAA